MKYVLWGQELTPGDPLGDIQKQYLRTIANHAGTSDDIKNVVINILEQDGTRPSYINMLMLDESIPDTPIPADEITTRARLALVSLNLFPGMDHAILSGKVDHLSAIQGAIAALRNLHSDVVPVNSVYQAQIPTRNWRKIIHYFVRVLRRYNSLKKRNLELAAEVVLLRNTISKKNGSDRRTQQSLPPTGGSGVCRNSEPFWR